MGQIKVSVCIPVYNGERFIREAIDSVLNQSYTDFELIIVDNQSTDSTVSIIRSYSDPRIKFFQNSTNIGLIPNWNMVMSKGTGEYIKILPADDLMYPDCLKLQVAVMDRDKEKRIAMVSGRKNVIDDKGRILLNRGFSKKEVEVSGIKAINRNMRTGGNIIGEGGAVLFRREILEKTGVFTSELFYILDLDMWYKILLHGNLYSIPQIVSAFRVSTISLSTVFKDTQLSDTLKFNAKLYSLKEYKISYYTHKVAALMAWASTVAKKTVYRFLLK